MGPSPSLLYSLLVPASPLGRHLLCSMSRVFFSFFLPLSTNRCGHISVLLPSHRGIEDLVSYFPCFFLVLWLLCVCVEGGADPSTPLIRRFFYQSANIPSNVFLGLALGGYRYLDRGRRIRRRMEPSEPVPRPGWSSTVLHDYDFAVECPIDKRRATGGTALH